MFSYANKLQGEVEAQKMQIEKLKKRIEDLNQSLSDEKEKQKNLECELANLRFILTANINIAAYIRTICRGLNEGRLERLQDKHDEVLHYRSFVGKVS